MIVDSIEDRILDAFGVALIRASEAPRNKNLPGIHEFFTLLRMFSNPDGSMSPYARDLLKQRINESSTLKAQYVQYQTYYIVHNRFSL